MLVRSVVKALRRHAVAGAGVRWHSDLGAPARAFRAFPELAHFDYGCDAEALAPELRRAFVELAPGEGTAAYLEAHQPHAGFETLGLNVLGAFLPKIDAAAMLGMHELHMLGE
jgi:hypothetical protein